MIVMAANKISIDDDLDDDILEPDEPKAKPKPDPKAQPGPSAAEMALQAELNRERALRIKAEEAHSTAQKTTAETRYDAVKAGIEATKATRARLVADQKAALEAADYDKVSRITDELADVAAEARQLVQEKAAADRRAGEGRVEEKKQPVSSGDVFEDWIGQMPASTQAYLRKHKDDVIQPHRNKRLLIADAMAQSDGFSPGTEAYFDAIDKHMGYVVKEEPEETGESDEPEDRNEPKRRVSAPPSREGSASNGSGKGVRLTPAEREIATHMGMTEASYAKQKERLRSKAYLESRTIGR